MPKPFPQTKKSHWLLRVRPALLADVLKTLFRVKRQPFSTNTGIFFIDPISILGDTLLRTGHYEPAMEQTLRSFLRPGDVYVDIGANEGYFCVLASALVKEAGRVIAVEPQRRLQPVLKRNFELNQCRNITVIPAAIAAQDGNRNFYFTASTNTGGSGMVRMTKYPLPSTSVQALTLSNLFDSQKIKKCRLVKIDVEGFEGEVIAGAHKLLEDKRIDIIALEYHSLALKRLGVSAEAIHAQLLGYSYRHTGSPTTLYSSPFS